MRHLRMLCLSLVLIPLNYAVAQSLQYDVISVKPHDDRDPGMGIRVGPTSYSANNIRLDNLIASAYGVKMWLVTGLPSWAKSSGWDIEAKMTDPPSRRLTREELHGLMKGLLQQRFGLLVHEEQRLQPVLEMTVVPNGPPLTSVPLGPPSADGTPARPKGGYYTGQGKLEGSINMESLAGTLSYQFEKTVIDKTGLTGFYDVKLHWTQDANATPNDNGTGDVPPALMEALREQLGLKLTPAKAEVPAVVVDAIKQPEAN